MFQSTCVIIIDMKTTRRTVILIIGFILALMLFTLTNPQSAPAAILIVPFILLYILFLYLFNVTLKRNVKALTSSANRRKRLSIAGILAALPVMLLALQSIGQLTVRDVITLVILISILGFYVTRISFTKNQSSQD